MNLSAHFKLEEFTFSQTAERNGIQNVPDAKVIENLIYLAKELENVRICLNNNAMRISSGYRSPLLNKAIGGSSKSQHCKGLAVDFTCPGFSDVNGIVEMLYKSGIPYDQCILEFGNWVHLSFPGEGKKPRKQTLIIDRSGVRNYK